MTKVIAIVNMKGGVGKTTLTLNLGAGLVEAGKRVLLIDCDPQANLSTSFDVETDIDQNIGTLLLRKHKFEDVVLECMPNMDLIPASYALTDIERELSTKMGSDNLLRLSLKPHRTQYDYVLIDCPPNQHTLTRNALTCADEFIVPILPDFFSWKGIQGIMKFANEATEYLNENLVLGGILINQYHPKQRNGLKRKIAESIRLDPSVGEKVFDTWIRVCTKLAESPSASKTVFELAPESSGAVDFKNLTQEILATHGKSN